MSVYPSFTIDAKRYFISSKITYINVGKTSKAAEQENISNRGDPLIEDSLL